ncbi:hypothetical protein KY336_04720 [Candidatus Woesearchaeota archaeon]|nr:hypothetical protein [Candidatus Woesearchaeota archaeon]
MSLPKLVLEARRKGADHKEILIKICQEIIGDLRRLENILMETNLWKKEQRDELVRTIGSFIDDLRELKNLPSNYKSMINRSSLLIHNLTAFAQRINRTGFKNSKEAFDKFYKPYILDAFEEELEELIDQVKMLD